jgi:hypothetical protein
MFLVEFSCTFGQNFLGCLSYATLPQLRRTDLFTSPSDKVWANGSSNIGFAYGMDRYPKNVSSRD